MSVQLSSVRPYSDRRPKGLATYNPTRKTTPTVERVVALYEQMREADALPLGPRQAGYRLKELYPGEYAKSDFESIGEIVKRLTQAGRLPFAAVSDAASVTYAVAGDRSPAEFLADVHEGYERDRTLGQPTVVEIYTEARETLGLIGRVASERGVTVYSGGGSAGPGLAYKVASRILRRAVNHGQSTLILGICDFDQAGIKNILRPHLEHVAAFLHGTAKSNGVIAAGLDRVTLDETPATASFDHLALTPVQADRHVASYEDRQRIVDYIHSGDDLWSRDLELISGVQKVELEALDPTELRRLVVDAIEDALDMDTLRSAEDAEAQEREEIRRLIEGAIS